MKRPHHKVYSNKFLLAMALILSLSGCVQKEPQPEASPQGDSVILPLPEQNEGPRLQDADPVADAEKAVVALDFRLLAFSNKVISFPGIDNQTYSVQWVDKHCGIRYLPGTGDTLRIGEDSSKRSLLKAYASSYNARVLKGCLVFQKNYSEP